MADIEVFKLNNCDPEEIEDIILKIEKSFRLNFKQGDFKDVKTFGDLCDIVMDRIEGESVNSCTSQQAFYKIRDAIIGTCSIDRDSLTLDTELSFIFPRRNRIYKVRQFRDQLGIRVNILGIKNWLGWFITVCFILSFGLLFINWLYALIAIAASIGMYRFSYLFGKELKINTVRQLTELVATEHYRLSRRNSKRYNKKEVVDTIKRIFINDLAVAESALNRDSAF
ncbi:hypothetical protein HQ865_16220 [Mucilaginibacter mali]|uniref:Uncharacterized protein n=1 Tax=Mucilaginibacter mali TaxID=2740462 RepID=A0A7D4UG26_9SPHI|nr:hypothetical protein [Mucilaginibacter mali]QKJ31236.1 hypothetical protein HQ865_16220 [Mucilaginibacter mali]